MKKTNLLASFICVGMLWTGQAMAKPQPADLFCDTVPAKGSQTVILPIKTWGRYSVRSSGEQPVAFSIADRRSGVLHRDGVPGERNGRIDLFLEIGDYKITTQGPKNAAARAVITAEPFKYPADFKPAYLLSLKENQLDLHDLQQCAFWFEVPKDTTVYIEASGRYLEDLRLWRDGEWLMKTHNSVFIARPKPETPLSGIILTASVPKGTYMAAAYGGKGKDWSIKSGDAPFYLQYGLETVDANVAMVKTMPAKGYWRFQVSNQVQTLVVEEPERTPLYVETPNGTDSIFAKSSAPRILLSCGNGGSVKISGTPGQVFTVQTLGTSEEEIAGNGGAWWVASLHSGNYLDQLGASGFIVENEYDSYNVLRNSRVVAVSADTISGDKEIAKRFNFLSDNGLTSYIWVESEGSYWVSPGGTAFQWRVYPFFTVPPPNYKHPDVQEGSAAVNLNRGIYVLELTPKKKGIASVVIQKTSLLGSVFKAGKEAVIGPDANRAWIPPRPSVQFNAFTTVGNRHYTIHLNNQDPEISALSVRQLPLDPDKPLAMWSKPGENLRVPVQLQGRRMVRLVDPRGVPVPFSINGKQYDKDAVLDSGAYTIEIPGTGRETRRLLLASSRPEWKPSVPPPPFPDEKRLALPTFPVIAQEKTSYLDLDRAAFAPYALTIDEPGMYRIETTGRLHTRLSLHDRFFNFVRNADGNGIGRNAMLIEYLLKGSYQIDVGAVGQSAGRLGLAAYRNQLVQGGTLDPSIDNRAMVPAYAGVSYAIRIPAPGQYTVESMGQRGSFPFRFEDKDGWPFEPVVNSRELSVALDKGEYRLLSLPVMQDGRRIARLTRGAERRTLKGKGPHQLEINVPLSSIWEDGPDTMPATFVFSLVSPITATLNTTDGFAAALYQKGKDTAVASWNATKRLDLEAGDYRLCLRPQKKSNHVPYQVSVSTHDLIPGLSYTLTRPQTLRVSVGAAGVAQIGSQGMLDVAATLYESDAKTVVAANDDGYLDWNFAISRVLKPGRYFLRVESAENAFTSTNVFMRALTDTVMAALSCENGKPAAVQCELTRRLAIFTVAPTDTGDILACALQGRSRCGLAVEKCKAGAAVWTPVAQEVNDAPLISIPRDARSAYRIKIWSESAGEESFVLTYYSTTAKYATWHDASGGLSGQAVALGNDYCGWFKLDLSAPDAKAPGHYRVNTGRDQLTGIGASAALDTVFVNESPSWFSAIQPYVWVEFHCEQAGRFSARLEPMALEKQTQVVMPFIGTRPRVFTTKQSNKSALLLMVESDGQHPFAALAASQGAGRSALAVRGIPVRMELWAGRDRSANVLLPGDEQRAVIWNSLPPVDGTRPQAKIACTELPLSDGGALANGPSTWTADAPGARVIHYAKSGAPACIRVTLPPRSAALVTRSDGSRSLECSFDDEPVVSEFFTDGGDLYLFALARDLRFDLTAFLADSGVTAARQLTPGKSWQAKHLRDGTMLLPLSGDMTKTARLFYHGPVNSLGWVDAGGMLHNDCPDGAPVGPGGFVKIDAGEGWIKLDLCEAATQEGIMAGKWGASLAPSNPVAVDRSSIVRLGDRVNWYTFTLADTQHVNFGAPLSLAAILLRDGKPVNYQEAWEQFNWDLPLGPGKYFLGIHPLAGASIEGGRMTVLYRPVGRLAEKQPFTGYLSPGESRLLRFDVQKNNRFGIGVRMSKETALACLYDSYGAVVAQGKQEFVELAKGTYYLWVHVPASAEGTALTLFLFGQEPPPNEPPEKLVKWIINGAQGPRPDITTTADDEPEQVKKRPAPAEESAGDQGGNAGGDQSGEQTSEPDNPDNGESDGPPPEDVQGEGE